MSSSRYPPPAPGEVVLYDYPMSPCARRVRITLIEKGVPCTRRMVDLARMEQKHPDYLALNPAGVVPTLQHGERVICESNVITAYLDQAFPEPRLYPLDPGERTEVERWQRFEADLQPFHRPLSYQHLLGPLLRGAFTLDQALARVSRQTDDPAQHGWEETVWRREVLDSAAERAARAELEARLDDLEQALAGRTFLVGERFTQADLSMFPRVRMLPYVGLRIERDRRPALVAWMRRLERRPSMRRTLSWMERAVQLADRLGVLPWLGRVTAPPAPRLRPADRLGLGLVRPLLRLDLVRAEIALSRATAGRA